MIDRANLGVVDQFNSWPRLSVPTPVKETFNDLVARLPQEVTVTVVDTGYHNAGWSYLEIEVKAPSFGRAVEEAERINMEVMTAFHLGAT